MKSHDLAKALLELPNVPVIAEANGYEAEEYEVEIAYFNEPKGEVRLDSHTNWPATAGCVFKPGGAVLESIKCPVCDFVGNRSSQKSAYDDLHAHVYMAHGSGGANFLRETLSRIQGMK